MYSNDVTSQNEDLNISGNTLIVAENSASSFKLKYAMINHRFNISIEHIFMENVE